MWPSKSITYSPIQFSDSASQETLALEKHDAQPLPKRTCWMSNLQSRTVQIIFAISTSLLIFLILLILSLIGSKNQLYDCGHSPAEAVAKNCHFDMLAFAWVPIPCFDDEYVLLSLMQPIPGCWRDCNCRLSSTYDTYNDFEFFYDRNRTRQIEIEELKRGINKRVYTSGQYHRTHCTYAWQTLQRAVLKGYGLSDNKTMNAGREWR
jgi:hypothetical protein